MPDDQPLPPQHLLPQPASEHLLPASTQPSSDLAMRMLYDEQARLRTELDTLKQQGDAAKSSGGEDGKPKGGDAKEGGKESGGGDAEKKQKPEDDLLAKKTKRARWAFLAVLIAVPLLLVMLLVLRYLSSYEDTDDAFIDGHTDPISTRINGTVANVFVENTYRVKKGQLLVQLDARDNQVAKEQADANFEQAEAAVRAQAPQVPITNNQQSTQAISSDLDVVRYAAQLHQNEAQYLAAVANVHEAEANEANGVREEERYRLLVVKDEVSREQYDQRLTQRNALAAQLAARRGTGGSRVTHHHAKCRGTRPGARTCAARPRRHAAAGGNAAPGARTAHCQRLQQQGTGRSGRA